METSTAGPATVRLSGDWTIAHRIPHFTLLDARVPGINLQVDASGIHEWDSLLPVFLTRLNRQAVHSGIDLSFHGLPVGVEKLLQLAQSRHEPPPQKDLTKTNPLARLGLQATRAYASGGELARFTGELSLEFVQLLRGKSYFRRRDFFYFIQSCGAEALPIVSLISLLVGIILAFVGAVQLQVFGAQIYVANLVGLAMVLEMGAMMSGVILAGRTGAAYAAQLGTMQVNEEIDALRTMGISPISFLVVPRMLALILMLPLLCIYADLLGIAGGAVVGTILLDLSLTEYLLQTKKALHLHQIMQGIWKSSVYGVLVGFAGCLRGMQCGRSASAVGEAATSAVVTAIVLIVVSDAIMNFIINMMK